MHDGLKWAFIGVHFEEQLLLLGRKDLLRNTAPLDLDRKKSDGCAAFL